MATTEQSIAPPPGYRIGAVSRLTGIPTETLRVWERRYAAVVPSRTMGGSRLYAREDISRLELIKQLVDQGHAISSVASLPLDELQSRLREILHIAQPGKAPVQTGKADLVLVGSTLPGKLLREKELLLNWPEQVRIVASQEKLTAQLAGDDSEDRFYIIECPTLTDDWIDQLSRLPVGRVILVYNYAETPLRQRLENLGVTLLRTPVNWTPLLRLCGQASAQPVAHTTIGEANQLLQSQRVAKRRFDDRQLARFLAMSTTVRCECPRHVAELVVMLNRFEIYSQECENRNDEDALLHNYLGVMAARARGLMEDAMKRLADIENIPLD